MIQRMISWRRNLFMLMLILLFFSSFSSHSKQLCFGWRFEHRHISDKGFQIVRRSVTNPAWCNRFRFSLRHLSAETWKKTVASLLYYLLPAGGRLWIKSFRYYISGMSAGDDCRTFCFIWEEPVKSGEDSFTLKIGISLNSDPVPAEDSELSVNFKGIRTSETSGSFLIPVCPDTVREDTCPETILFSHGFLSPKHKSSVEDEMRKFYNSLSEKDRRRYAGIEAMKAGQGGIVRISRILGCNRKTVSKGIRELRNLPPDTGYQKRIRKIGGGRKCYRQTWPGIDDMFSDVIENYTAGDPMREGALRTNLSYERIADEIFEKHGIKISTKVTRQLIRKHKFGKRGLQKNITMKQVENRNEQFENIAGFKEEFYKTGNPVISMDSKKRKKSGIFSDRVVFMHRRKFRYMTTILKVSAREL